MVIAIFVALVFFDVRGRKIDPELQAVDPERGWSCGRSTLNISEVSGPGGDRGRKMKKKRVLMSAADVGRWRKRGWHFRLKCRGRHGNELICVFFLREDEDIFPLGLHDVKNEKNKMNNCQFTDVMTGGIDNETRRLKMIERRRTWLKKMKMAV